MNDTDFAVGGGVPGQEAEETEDGDNERDRRERGFGAFIPYSLVQSGGNP